MIVEVLSDHPGDELRRLEAAREADREEVERHLRLVDQRRLELRAQRGWWNIRARRHDEAEVMAMNLARPRLDSTLSRRYAQQAAGVAGEEQLTSALLPLTDEWHLFRGYVNRRGEMDHLLVGPGGVWAVEAKARAVTINVAGDHWTFEKHDRYGNLVGHGALVDGRNRSWGRQVTEVADELERFIHSQSVLASVRTAAVVLSNRARLGTVDDLRVDLLCVGPGQLLERLRDAAPELDAEQRRKTVNLIKRDHAFHAQRRLQRSRPDPQ